MIATECGGPLELLNLREFYQKSYLPSAGWSIAKKIQLRLLWASSGHPNPERQFLLQATGNANLPSDRSDASPANSVGQAFPGF